jgi:hypothetical protein
VAIQQTPNTKAVPLFRLRLPGGRRESLIVHLRRCLSGKADQGGFW